MKAVRILSLDVGTQSARAIVFADAGKREFEGFHGGSSCCGRTRPLQGQPKCAHVGDDVKQLGVAKAQARGGAAPPGAAGAGLRGDPTVVGRLRAA